MGACRGRHEPESCRVGAAAHDHRRTRLGDPGRRGRWLRRLYARPAASTPEQVSSLSLSRRRTRARRTLGRARRTRRLHRRLPAVPVGAQPHVAALGAGGCCANSGCTATSSCRGRREGQPGPRCVSPPNRDPLTTSNNGGVASRYGRPRATAARLGCRASTATSPGHARYRMTKTTARITAAIQSQPGRPTRSSRCHRVGRRRRGPWSTVSGKRGARGRGRGRGHGSTRRMMLFRSGADDDPTHVERLQGGPLNRIGSRISICRPIVRRGTS